MGNGKVRKTEPTLTATEGPLPGRRKVQTNRRGANDKGRREPWTGDGRCGEREDVEGARENGEQLMLNGLGGLRNRYEGS